MTNYCNYPNLEKQLWSMGRKINEKEFKTIEPKPKPNVIPGIVYFIQTFWTFEKCNALKHTQKLYTESNIQLKQT